VKDPALVLGWIWAIYLAGRLAAEALDMVVLPRLIARDQSAAATGASRDKAGRRRWTPLPALIWLAGEACLAAVVVGVAWLALRDVSVNLVPAAVTAGPSDVRRAAVAVIIGWSLVVINVPVAMRLIGRLLPTESKKAQGGVDPERMGATIGVLERVLLIALLPGGGSAAVGLVVAAKTLARFKELDKKRFAERYLLGTMTSVTIALVSCLVAQWVWANAL
jgi:hypothetical protein